MKKVKMYKNENGYTLVAVKPTRDLNNGFRFSKPMKKVIYLWSVRVDAGFYPFEKTAFIPADADFITWYQDCLKNRRMYDSDNEIALQFDNVTIFKDASGLKILSEQIL